MRNEYYKIAPQMKDYHAAKYVFAPYVMQTNAPNYRSPYFSTDGFGFRTTIYQDAPLSLLEYHDPKFDGQRAALVGNSTSFGVGATSDAKTIPSLLNNSTSKIWFNYSGRTFQSTQELIMFLLFAPHDVEQIVIFSGINNFDMSYRWFNTESIYFPPFYSQAIYQAAFTTYFEQGAGQQINFDNGIRGFLKQILKSAWRCITDTTARPHPPANSFFPKYIKEQLFSHSRELYHLLDDPHCIERSLQKLERDLQLWVRIFGHDAISFILQPIPNWTNKVFSYEETKLFEYVRQQRGDKWEQISNFLADHETQYRNELRCICNRCGVDFFDANEFPSLLDDQWMFLDRYHLTDRGQALIAQFISDNLI